MAGCMTSQQRSCDFCRPWHQDAGLFTLLLCFDVPYQSRDPVQPSLMWYWHEVLRVGVHGLQLRVSRSGEKQPQNLVCVPVRPGCPGCAVLHAASSTAGIRSYEELQDFLRTHAAARLLPPPGADTAAASGPAAGTSTHSTSTIPPPATAGSLVPATTDAAEYAALDAGGGEAMEIQVVGLHAGEKHRGTGGGPWGHGITPGGLLVHPGGPVSHSPTAARSIWGGGSAAAPSTAPAAVVAAAGLGDGGRMGAGSMVGSGVGAQGAGLAGGVRSPSPKRRRTLDLGHQGRLGMSQGAAGAGTDAAARPSYAAVVGGGTPTKHKHTQQPGHGAVSVSSLPWDLVSSQVEGFDEVGGEWDGGRWSDGDEEDEDGVSGAGATVATNQVQAVSAQQQQQQRGLMGPHAELLRCVRQTMHTLTHREGLLSDVTEEDAQEMQEVGAATAATTATAHA